MKRVISWIVTVLALVLSFDYFMDKNIISGVAMLVAAIIWTPYVSGVMEKLFHTKEKSLASIRIIVLLVALIISSVRISF